jgi:hypothetical protein
MCYISDLAKIRSHYPGWNPTRTVPDMIDLLCRIVAQETIDLSHGGRGWGRKSGTLPADHGAHEQNSARSESAKSPPRLQQPLSR